MANGNVRYTERSYMAVLLERDPDFYADRNRQVEYEFANGRQFIARTTYSSYGPTFSYVVYYGNDPVYYGAEKVQYEMEPI